MAATRQTNGPNAQGVDAVFSGTPRSGVPSSGRRKEPPPPARSYSEASLPSSPLGEAVDLRAERQWLAEERKGLEAHLRHQFAAIREEREKLVAQEAKLNEELALRQHKMKRQTALLVARVDALKQGEGKLAEREARLATQLEKVTRAEEELQALQLAAAQLQKDTEAQRSQAEQGRAALVRMQDQLARTRAELAAVEEARDKASTAAEEELAGIMAMRSKMEQRYAALEKAEAGLNRRTIELDEMEVGLQAELEQREQELTRKQRRNEKLWKRLKQTSAMVRRDRDAQKILTEQYRKDTAQLQEAASQARAEFTVAEEALTKSRLAREREEAEWSTRQQREQTEWTVQRKQEETEWKTRRQREETEWAAQRQQEETEWKTRRQREETEWTAQRQREEADLTARRAEIEQDERTLAGAQEGFQQRLAAVETGEARLQKERDRGEHELSREKREIELLGAKLRSQAQQIETELSQTFGSENWRSVLGLLAPAKEETPSK